MNPTEFREHFPGVETQIYLDVAARGLLPVDARRALDDYLDTRMLEGGNKAAMFEQLERVRSQFAALIGAASGEIAFTKNVSEGLNAIVAAYPWTGGDRVVYCPALEHPNNVYPWRHLAARRGVELVEVPAEGGEISPDRIIAALDERTRMVSLSSVTFAPGLVTDVAAIGAVCRERGILLLVDAVQSVGLLATDVEALGIDALAVSTQKGLLALYGMGFLYCRAAWAERLEPAYLARFSVDLGDAHEAATGSDGYALMPGAKRFEVGNYNFAGAAAAEASLSLLGRFPPSALENHVRSLSAQLATGLAELGLALIGPAHGPARGSMVCIGALGAGGHDSVDDPALSSLHAFLTERQVRLSIRRGLLRFSVHAYNTAEEMAQVIALAREWQKQPSRSSGTATGRRPGHTNAA